MQDLGGNHTSGDNGLGTVALPGETMYHTAGNQGAGIKRHEADRSRRFPFSTSIYQGTATFAEWDEKRSDSEICGHDSALVCL
jgi:hypothetical protein